MTAITTPGLPFLMRKLGGVLDQETSLVRSGDFAGSVALEPEKNTLIAEFHDAVWQLDADAKTEIADELDTLKQKLADNLSALAMARDVSTSIIRRVSDVVNGPRAANSYGANGKKPTAALPARRGIAVDKGF
tara:strand:+ start:949 stop:1347 length:399 start_codon:yes stop_codon:yes gene_type:complete